MDECVNIIIMLFLSLQDYGIDWNGPCVGDFDVAHVSVPPTPFPLSEQQLDQLKQLVVLMQPCDDHATALYSAVREFVHSC